MLQKIQLRNAVEQVLHVPGNYRGGILEMTIVFDCNLSKQTSAETAKELANALKQQNELFRNVRLNTIQWRNDDELIKEITPMVHLQMGTYFNSYEQFETEKTLEILTGQLKKFYARSKLIIALTDGKYTVQEPEILEESLKPFLGTKLILVKVDEESGKTCVFRI